MNLANGTYQPYRKPNDHPVYINIQSNHPPQIIKHIPCAIEKKDQQSIIKPRDLREIRTNIQLSTAIKWIRTVNKLQQIP